jgi:endonuclease YncB( thermonuclease family)
MLRYCCFYKNVSTNHKQMELIQTATYDNALPFVPPIKYGKVIKVYDGDTLTIAAQLPYPESPIYRFQVRLNGIDTPEIKSKSATEKTLAANARDALSNLLLHKIVQLKNTANEKYGRLLADVYLGELHVNQWMIDNKFAVRYDGGTKHRPDEWVNE